MMPPHAVYIEAFLGGGAVLRNKLPAVKSIGIDLDPSVARSWARTEFKNVEIITADTIDFLSSFQFAGDELLYCDPPYLPETRRKRRIYRCEYDRTQHERLLALLMRLPCRIMISGYRSDLYETMLSRWRDVDFAGDSHVGPRIETVWMNFDPPETLHDYRYIGSTFRERESIRRRREAISRRIDGLDIVERNAFLKHLAERYPSSASIHSFPIETMPHREGTRR